MCPRGVFFDTVAAFLSHCCELKDGAEIDRGEIYAAYTTYCEQEGYKAVSRIACYNRFRSFINVGERRDKKGPRFFTGVMLNNAPSLADCSD